MRTYSKIRLNPRDRRLPAQFGRRGERPRLPFWGEGLRGMIVLAILTTAPLADAPQLGE